MPPDPTRIDKRITRSPSLTGSSVLAQLDEARKRNEQLREEVKKRDKQLARYRRKVSHLQDRLDEKSMEP